MKKIILVSGSGEAKTLSPKALEIAEKVGFLIAKKGGIIICGGMGGVMEAVCRGAKRKGGITVGFLPAEKEKANPFVDIPLPMGVGLLRNYLLVNCADAIIGIGGRWGTLNEISLGLNLGKPVILIRGTGGWADLLAEIKREKSKTEPRVVSTPEEAVELAFYTL